ncbi:MAG TPA: ribosome maturation factor RimM [Prolixibacteraceae bacterium]|nr:ribosome maturation factor RimM [Prolixibacteraceae bacterium]
MQTIDRNQFIEAGSVKKTHGIRGELLLSFDEGWEEILEEVDYLFFEVEGLLVPFFIREISFRGDASVLFLFDLIDTKESAREYTGCRVFVDQKWLKNKKEGLHISFLKGFTVIDSQMGIAGVIKELSNYGGNLVATIDYQGKELMLPVNDDLVVAIDRDRKTLTMDCPPGILPPRR